MNCLKATLCHFHQKRSTAKIDGPAWEAAAAKYCADSATSRNCAIFQVMDRLGFLKCPKDLLPSETQRAARL